MVEVSEIAVGAGVVVAILLLSRRAAGDDTDPDPEPDPEYLTESRRPGSAQTVEISVFTTQALYDRHGRTPEESVVENLASGIDHMGLDVDVNYAFDPQPAESEVTGCGSDGEWQSGAYSWWTHYAHEQGNVPDEYISKDTNVLLTDAGGGGCGTPGGGTYCVAGARGLDRHVPWSTQIKYKDAGDTRQGSYDDVGRVYAALHEVGHNFDQGHGTGTVVNDSGVTTIPPNGAGSGTTKCGGQSQARNESNTWYFLPHWSSDCARSYFVDAIE